MLTIRVTDAMTGEPIPCRLQLELAEGSRWVPQEPARGDYSETEAPELLLPGHFEHCLHLCQGANLQSVHLNHGQALLDVPTGEVTLRLNRGHEYVPATDRFTVGPAPVVREYQLERLIDMPAQGWYSGDPHVHLSRFTPDDDHVWLRLMEAEDLYVLNSLIFKHDGGVIQAPQYAMGTAAERRRGKRVLASGEEFRDGDLYGHMILAGIEEVVEPISVGPKLGVRDNYPLFTTACDETHRQGGVVGWAHGGGVFNRLFESLPLEAALGKVDFVEVIQFNMFFGCHFWRQLLNCGLQLGCTAASDFPFGADMLAPWFPNLGLDRTYALVEGEFTYRAWLESLRTGRCFATNGPLVFLTVNGKTLGSKVHLEGPGEEVAVEARAICNYPLDHLDVLCNGGVVRRIAGGAGQRELAWQGKLRLTESSWIAAYAHGEVDPADYGGVNDWHLRAHTSPVYALIQGNPVRVATDLTSMADYVRLCLARYLPGTFFEPGQFSSDAQVRELVDNCRKALDFYEAGIGAPAVP